MNAVHAYKSWWLILFVSSLEGIMLARGELGFQFPKFCGGGVNDNIKKGTFNENILKTKGGIKSGAGFSMQFCGASGYWWSFCKAIFLLKASFNKFKMFAKKILSFLWKTSLSFSILFKQRKKILNLSSIRLVWDL